MGTLHKIHDVPWPMAGLNLNAPPTELAQNEAYELQNLVVTPREVRLRRPSSLVDYYGDVMSVNSDDTILGIKSLGVKVAVSLLRSADDSSATGSQYYTGEKPGISTFVSGTSRVLHTADITADPFAVVTTGSLDDYRTWGRHARFEDSVYGVSWENLSDGQNRYGDANQEGPQIFQWAGANRADHSTTTGANLTVGSRSVTLAATHATSLAGTIMTPGTGSSYDNQRWNYVVEEHAAGTANVILSQPWGYGDPTVTTLVSGATVNFRAQVRIFQAPVGVAAVETHRGRLFAGRGYINTSSISAQWCTTAVFWSYPGNPSYWPTNNYLLIDGEFEDPIMGMCSTRQGLLVFKKRKTYMITGYDESSFAVELLSSSIGLTHSQSILDIDDVVVWHSSEGIMMWDGAKIVDISEPSIDTGISSELDNEFSDFAFDGWPVELPSISYAGNYVFLHQGSILQEDKHPIWVYNRLTRAWSTMAMGDDTLASPNGLDQRQFGLLARIDDRLYIFCREGVYDIEDCYNHALPTATTDVFKEYIIQTAGGAIGSSTAVKIHGMLSQLVKPAADDTVRLRELEVFHNCQYYILNDTLLYDMYGVNVTANFGAGSETLQGRLKCRNSGLDGPNYTIPYSDRFTSTAGPIEGSMFLINIDTRDVASVPSGAYRSGRVHKLRLYMDPQSVRHGRVDSTAPAQ